MPQKPEKQTYQTSNEITNRISETIIENIRQIIGAENSATFSIVKATREAATIISTKESSKEIFKSLIEEGIICMPIKPIEISPNDIIEKTEDNNKILEYTYEIDPNILGQQDFTTMANIYYIKKELVNLNLKNKAIKLKLDEKINQNNEKQYTISIEYKDQNQKPEELAEEVANIIATSEIIKKYKKIKPYDYKNLISTPGFYAPEQSTTTVNQFDANEINLSSATEDQKAENLKKPIKIQKEKEGRKSEFLKLTIFGSLLLFVTIAATIALSVTSLVVSWPIIIGLAAGGGLMSLTAIFIGVNSKLKENQTTDSKTDSLNSTTLQRPINTSSHDLDINEISASNHRDNTYDSKVDDFIYNETRNKTTKPLDPSQLQKTETNETTPQHYSLSYPETIDNKIAKLTLKRKGTFDNEITNNPTTKSNAYNENESITNQNTQQIKEARFYAPEDFISSEISTQETLPSTTNLTDTESKKLSKNKSKKLF